MSSAPRGSHPTSRWRRISRRRSTALLLPNHLWRYTETWDPEGFLSTFPAIATALLGLLAGEWLRSARTPQAKTYGFLAAGALLTAAGVSWGEWAPAGLLFPINKALWSPSFVLLTAGLGLGLLRPQLLADGRPRLAALGSAVRVVRQECDRPLRRLRAARAHSRVDRVGRGPRRRALPPRRTGARAAVRLVAAAARRLVRLRPRHGPALVRGRAGDGPARHLRQGLSLGAPRPTPAAGAAATVTLSRASQSPAGPL